MSAASPMLPGSPEARRAADEVVAADMVDMAARLEPVLHGMEGARLLMTGGAGFLGHAIVQLVAHWNREHAALPIETTVVDNYVRGMPDWLAELDGHDGIRCVTADATQPLPDDVPDQDYVVHAASIASPTFYRRFPLETMDANVTGLRLLLDRSVAQAQAGHPLTAFLFFSSSEIYGDPPPEHIPTPEAYRGNVSCTGPRACYDESKRYGETLAVTFARHYDVPVRVVRPFNNYGPGLRLGDKRVLPDFARDVLAGEDIVMHSDGTPTRTFCYVADAVVGYLLALAHGRDGEAYNIGRQEPEVSMNELARRTVELGRELVDYRGRVVRRPSDEDAYLTDNPIRRRPDISKARAELGYEPIIDLDEGLRRSMIWYRGRWSLDQEEA